MNWIIGKIGLENTLRIAFYIFCFLAGYYCCYLRSFAAEKEYIAQAEQQRAQLIEQARAQEWAAQVRIGEIETKNINEQAQEQAKYEAIINELHNRRIADTTSVQCPNTGSTSNMSAKASNTGALECYTRGTLQGKIRESLAITRECDKLASDYNALLEICK